MTIGMNDDAQPASAVGLIFFRRAVCAKKTISSSFFFFNCLSVGYGRERLEGLLTRP